MSTPWSEMRELGRACLILALLLAAGCGFRPLYGEDYAGPASLSGVRIAMIQDRPDRMGGNALSARAAQHLRNDLMNRITPRGQPAPAQYELHVILTETKSATIGLRSDETATRSFLRLVAAFWVVRLEGGGLILNTQTLQDV